MCTIGGTIEPFAADHSWSRVAIFGNCMEYTTTVPFLSRPPRPGTWAHMDDDLWVEINLRGTIIQIVDEPGNRFDPVLPGLNFGRIIRRASGPLSEKSYHQVDPSFDPGFRVFLMKGAGLGSEMSFVPRALIDRPSLVTCRPPPPALPI